MESNHRPPACQAGALTTELRAYVLKTQALPKRKCNRESRNLEIWEWEFDSGRLSVLQIPITDRSAAASRMGSVAGFGWSKSTSGSSTRESRGQAAGPGSLRRRGSGSGRRSARGRGRRAARTSFWMPARPSVRSPTSSARLLPSSAEANSSAAPEVPVVTRSVTGSVIAPSPAFAVIVSLIADCRDLDRRARRRAGGRLRHRLWRLPDRVPRSSRACRT